MFTSSSRTQDLFTTLHDITLSSYRYHCIEQNMNEQKDTQALLHMEEYTNACKEKNLVCVHQCRGSDPHCQSSTRTEWSAA